MPANLRERKKVDTRRRLETVALDLFLTRGYAATTVEDVAEAAGVSVRTFYRYYRSKDALLFWRFGPALEAMCAAIRSRDRSLPVLQSLRNAISGVADVLEDTSEVLKHVWIIGAEDPSVEVHGVQEITRWRGAFIAEIAAQTGLPTYDRGVQLVAIALHSTISAGVAQWRGNGGQGPLAREVRLALEQIGDLAGIADAFPSVPA